VRRRVVGAALAALVVALAVAGCGRSARDGGGETATLPATTPVASELAASVTDAATSGAASADPAPVAVTDTGEGTATQPRLADLVSASIDQRAGTLTVRVELARPLDGGRLADDEQVAVGAYLLANPDDDDPYAARVLIDAGQRPRFLFGPWLGQGRPIDGTLDGTMLTLVVPGLTQGRFRYAQFFAEDPSGGETLPDDTAGLVAINAG
jgi:hypothetical protein